MSTKMDELKATARAGRKAIEEMIADGRATPEREALAHEGVKAAEDIADTLRADALMKRMESFPAPEGSGDRENMMGRQGGDWAKSVAGRLRTASAGAGVKALLTGEVSTPPQVEVSALPELPHRLLDLIRRTPLTEQTFSYLREVVKTSNASVVADSALKPTSIFSFVEIEDRARVIAHLSEKFPVRYASDHNSLVQVLNSQMVAGVFGAIQALIVAGDPSVAGHEEEWVGLLNVVGTTPVSFATNAITTLRKARTALENKGERVTACAMNPTDIEALDLLRDGAGGTVGGFLLDSDAYERILGPGVRGVPSLSVPAGTAIVGDFTTLELRVREDAATLAATQAGTLFDTNEMKLRSEGRFGFAIKRPQAIAVVELVSGT